MAEYETRKAGSKKDRITELPRNIQEIILCLLPIQDAVRTSILSRKWRHCWTTIPQLVFDYEFDIFMMKKLSHCRERELAAFKFVSVIYKCLLLHNGPILNFSFKCPLSGCDEEIIHDQIDQWVSFLGRNGLKQLTIEDNDHKEDITHHFTSLGLTHLRLIDVSFTYTPEAGVFTKLKNLELVEVTSNFGHSIFDFPVLEKLTLIICDKLFHTNFRAPNLKCLLQLYDYIDSEYSLRGLENLKDCCFMLSQNAQTMGAIVQSVVKVLGSLPKIERFSIGMDYLWYMAQGGSPRRLRKSHPYLKTLNISDIHFTNLLEVSCLLCMIRSAPNLCQLHISGTCDAVEKDPKNYWVEDAEDCTTLNQLKIVTFSGLVGNKAELELIKFILGHSPLLKTMSIHHIDTMEKDVALTMARKMLEYPRASSRAQIRHLEDPYEMDGFEFELWAGGIYSTAAAKLVTCKIFDLLS